MDFENVKDYFNDIIKKYPPYRQSKMFEVMMDFIVNTYLKDIYSENLSDMKQLFEEKNIPTNIYDQLLISIGVPKKLINKLNFQHKIVFLKSLSDFQRYKGSVLFFQNVAKSFSDKFNIYELYVDYDDTIGNWILKPYPLYIGSDVESNLTTLLYEEAYEKIPTLMITIDQLNSIRSNNNAIFPIKTNLLLLDYNISREIKGIGNLVISSFLKEYKILPVTVYFKDQNFDFNFKDLYYIWYYIVTRYYNIPWIKFELQQIIHFSENATPYNMQELDDLITIFEGLDSSNDIAAFYEDYISPYFSVTYKNSEKTYIDMETNVIHINQQFFDYLENRIGSLSGSDLTQEVNELLTEIYNSLILFYRNNSDDPYILKYFEYILYSLPQILLNPKNTISYSILYNFKPFHTEFVSQVSESIISNSKFDTITPGDSDISFAIDLPHTDFIGDLNDINRLDIYYETWNVIDILSSLATEFEYNLEEDLLIDDNFEIIEGS